MNVKTNDRVRCCVYGCKSSRKSDINARFHNFPLDGYLIVKNFYGVDEKVSRRKVWENALGMKNRATKSMRVCGKHFTQEDYLPSISKRPSLKKTAAPSQNLPSSPIPSKPSMSRSIKIRFRESEGSKNSSQTVEPLYSISHQSNHLEEAYDDLNDENGELGLSLEDLDEKVPVDALMSINAKRVEEPFANVLFEDKGVQVESGDSFASFSSKIESEKKLNALTGLPNFQILDDICHLVDKMFTTKRVRKLTLKDRIVLVFVKMKIAIKFKALSIFFGLSPTACREIFNEYVVYISKILQSSIRWPSIEECRANIPECFKQFSSVRCIVDCIEIPLQKAKRRCCRIRTYSNYKGRNTVKVMTGVSPGGLITFLSPAYGGQASDKAIFYQSELIEKMEPHIDTLMVDKGFLVDELCTRHFIKIARPLFLRKNKQFTRHQAIVNVKEAKARVHVERANQRIRLFDIFNTALPWNMVPYIDNMLTIACAVVNLQRPVLREQRLALKFPKLH